MIWFIILGFFSLLFIVLSIIFQLQAVRKQKEAYEAEIQYWKGLFQETKKERDQLLRKNKINIKKL